MAGRPLVWFLPFTLHLIMVPEGRYLCGKGTEKWALLAVFALVIKCISNKGNTFSVKDSRSFLERILPFIGHNKSFASVVLDLELQNVVFHGVLLSFSLD